MTRKFAGWLLPILILLPSMLCGQSDSAALPELGSYVFGALEARAIGPAVMGGRLSALAVVDDHPTIIYVGAAAGGVWKSTDGGVSFEPVFDKHPQSIGAIAIDQARPDTVWVGTGEPWVRNSVSVGAGVYRTTDGGRNWELMGLEATERIGDIIISPENPEIVYVAALGHLWNANEERGLYKTTDGGATWEKILYVDENTGCTDIAIDPQEPDNIYAAFWEFRRQPWTFNSGGPGSGLFKSSDAGATWKKLSEGLPTGEMGRIAVAVAPSRPSVLYAVVEAEETGFYRSTDLGETWEKRKGFSNNVKARPFYFSLLLVDPEDYDRVYKPATYMSATADGGESFAVPLGLGGVHPDLHAMWINPNNPRHLLIGTDGGIYVSWDRGISWLFLNSLPLSQFYQISCDNEEPYNVYGGLQDNGSWFGPSSSPGGIENRDWENLGGGDGFHVFADQLDPTIVYWQYQGGKLLRKDLNTGENKDIQPLPSADEPEYRWNWNTALALSPTDPAWLYVGSQFLHRSNNRGDSWERLSGDLTTNDASKQKQRDSGGLTIDNTTAENHCSIFTISESPLEPAIIWVGTDDGNLQVTENDGDNWRNVVANIDGLPEHTWCSSVAAGHHDRNTAYATFDGHRTGDMTTYIYRTTDLGQSWEALTDDSLTGYAHIICEDLVNPNLLFLGTEFGLYISIDGGSQWARFTEGLPRTSVRDMVIQPRENDLVLGTHGRGVYIIDDITPLRQITADVLVNDVHLFETSPVIPGTFSWMQQFPGAGDFVGRNPVEVARLAYYLKKRHILGDMKIEIFNPEGELIKTLPGGKRKGLNLVNWYMRMKPPKTAAAKTLAPGAMIGPMLPEGVYTYKLTKGKDSYEGEVVIAPDPNSPHSAEDRALQQQTVLKLYQLTERIAYLGAATTETRDQAEERAEGLRQKDGLRKRLESFVDELNEFNDSLVVTDDETQGITGDERLREKVTGLYLSVMVYGGRPTASQLARFEVFEREVERFRGRLDTIMANRVEKLNSDLMSKDLEPLKLLTEDEFEKRQGS